jgi:hypothetical protein
MAEIVVNRRSLTVVKKLRGTLSAKGEELSIPGARIEWGEDAVGSQGLSDRRVHRSRVCLNKDFLRDFE